MATATKSEENEKFDNEDFILVIKQFLPKFLTWITVYTLGYFNFSIAWLTTPLLLIFLRIHWKNKRCQKLVAARETVQTDERSMIQKCSIRPQDLPSWIFFPDKERAEWTNSIIHQLWPNIGHFTKKILSEKVEPKLQAKFESMGISGFKFEKVDLGSIPPRISGIKVYEKNVSSSEIVLDLDLVLASDCDINFSLKNVTILQISNFSLRGLLRVVLKPLLTDMPLIGGFQYCFLSSPEIDYDLGGVANVVNMIPGLDSIIRNIIMEKIEERLVWPNKQTKILRTRIQGKHHMKCYESAGVLRVNLIRAENLKKEDVFGESDPYATLQVGGGKKKQTKTVTNTSNPEWFYTADFPIDIVRGPDLKIKVFDCDGKGHSDYLGNTSVAVWVIEKHGEIEEQWWKLKDVPNGKILMSLSWLETSKDISVLENCDYDEGLSKCLLHVYIDSCHNLQSLDQSSSKPSVRIELQVKQNDCQTTYVIENNSEPIFQQEFVFLIKNPYIDDLSIKVIDKDESVIASTIIRTSDIMAQPDMEYVCQPFQLKGEIGGNPVISLSANVRCLQKAKKTNILNEETELSLSKDLPSGQPDKKKSLEYLGAAALNCAATVVTESNKSKIISSNDGKTLNQELSSPGEIEKSTETVDGSLGEILISLCYLSTKQKLSVKILKAKNLPNMDITGLTDPYVKLLLFHNEKRIAKRKTHVKRNTLNPTFNDTFDFDLPYEENNLKNIKLDCVLLDRDRTSKNTVVGHLAFGGEKCKGTAFKHWNEIITFPSREVEEWHKLCD